MIVLSKVEAIKSSADQSRAKGSPVLVTPLHYILNRQSEVWEGKDTCPANENTCTSSSPSGRPWGHPLRHCAWERPLQLVQRGRDGRGTGSGRPWQGEESRPHSPRVGGRRWCAAQDHHSHPYREYPWGNRIKHVPLGGKRSREYGFQFDCRYLSRLAMKQENKDSARVKKKKNTLKHFFFFFQTRSSRRKRRKLQCFIRNQMKVWIFALVILVLMDVFIFFHLFT